MTDIEQVKTALKRIAESDIYNFDTLHPSACAGVARKALAALSRIEAEGWQPIESAGFMLLARQWSGRADDCGRLSRAVLEGVSIRA